MTDTDVLDLIMSGDLRVDVYTAQVVKSGKRITIHERTHPDGPQRGTYRFVTICNNGKKKRVALHRLVWMAFNQRLVPDGFDIDHKRSQDDDTITNLRLLESSVNRGLPHKKEKEEAF